MFFSDAVLLGLMRYVWLPRWPKSATFTTFFTCEIIVVVVTALLNPREVCRVATEFVSVFARILPQNPPENPQASALPWYHALPQIERGYLLFGILLPTIAINLYGIGWLVNRTGGLTRSPFAQIPFIMLVLGLVMAAKKPTQTVLFVAGLAYIALLTHSSFMGETSDHALEHVRQIENTFVWVTVLSLVVSWLVNLVARPSRRATASFVIHRANYGTDTESKDVTDLVRALIVDGRLRTVASNDVLGGDPLPNVKKKLRIEYELNGERSEREFDENESVELP